MWSTVSTKEVLVISFMSLLKLGSLISAAFLVKLEPSTGAVPLDVQVVQVVVVVVVVVVQFAQGATDDESVLGFLIRVGPVVAVALAVPAVDVHVGQGTDGSAGVVVEPGVSFFVGVVPVATSVAVAVQFVQGVPVAEPGFLIRLVSIVPGFVVDVASVAPVVPAVPVAPTVPASLQVVQAAPVAGSV
jgi:hypothetical protein